MRKTVLVLTAVLAFGPSSSQASTAEQAAQSSGSARGAVAGTQGSPPGQTVPPGHPAMGGTKVDTGLSGTVVETMNASGYTYMRLKTAEGEVWAAVKESKVAQGSTVKVVDPIPMDGFESKTLNRKFDRIVFGALAEIPGPTAAPASLGAQHAQAASGPAVTGEIKVARAEGPAGRTVAQVFAERALLKGKPVAVRGKVVKYSAEIMGKNWIHLRDGSGTREGKNDDLTITTADAAAVGDVVLVKGVVAVDRDFGAGYTYALVIEEARISK